VSLPKTQSRVPLPALAVFRTTVAWSRLHVQPSCDDDLEMLDLALRAPATPMLAESRESRGGGKCHVLGVCYDAAVRWDTSRLASRLYEGGMTGPRDGAMRFSAPTGP